MKILHITLIAACMSMAACTSIDEEAYRGAGIAAAVPKGTDLSNTDLSGAGIYRFKVRKLGGAFTGTNSMGGTYASDDQVSFKDAMQAAAGIATTVYGFKAYAAAEVTKRFMAGEITKQQAQQLQFEISKIMTEADVTKFLAGLAAAG